MVYKNDKNQNYLNQAYALISIKSSAWYFGVYKVKCNAVVIALSSSNSLIKLIEDSRNVT